MTLPASGAVGLAPGVLLSALPASMEASGGRVPPSLLPASSAPASPLSVVAALSRLASLLLLASLAPPPASNSGSSTSGASAASLAASSGDSLASSVAMGPDASSMPSSGEMPCAQAEALANAAHNAAFAQQQSNIMAQAATTMGVAVLLGIDTAATGKATQAILGG